MDRPIAIALFRRDLRLSDNPALRAAIAHGGAVVPVFLWDPDEEPRWPTGAASRWWLHHSLTALAESLSRAGSRLVIRSGETLDTLRRLIAETGATAVHWNQRPEPARSLRDDAVADALRKERVEVSQHAGALLHDPTTLRTKAGTPFRVFTPFWRNLSETIEPETPLSKPRQIAPPVKWPESLSLQALRLLPSIDWAGGLRAAWKPGEAGALQCLRAFAGEPIHHYDAQRDFPTKTGTSRLSPHLHFGEITPRQIWSAAADLPGAAPYLRQLAWREFAHHLLWHFPETADTPLRPEFAKFPWREDAEALRAWQRGRTGYPIVDAGMRELWETGWMHNRVRMIVASFLIKDLLIDWREGARWFWDTLVDADLANNTLGWQWVAGCGADAAPYFRIFNPVTQGEKFDPEGAYIRRWVPELGTPDYPAPIVDHRVARRRALMALEEMKGMANGAL